MKQSSPTQWCTKVTINSWEGGKRQFYGNIPFQVINNDHFEPNCFPKQGLCGSLEDAVRGL